MNGYPQHHTPVDLAARPLFGPDEARARLDELSRLIREYLAEGEDYGLAEGALKPIRRGKALPRLRAG